MGRNGQPGGGENVECFLGFSECISADDGLFTAREGGGDGVDETGLEGGGVGESETGQSVGALHEEVICVTELCWGTSAGKSEFVVTGVEEGFVIGPDVEHGRAEDVACGEEGEGKTFL